MKKIIALTGCLAIIGCASFTTTDRSSIFNDASGKYLSVNTITVRDRTGTEMHHVLVLDDKDAVVSQATASGRGIVPGMTDGVGASLIQTGGLIGAAAVWPNSNYSGGNAVSDQSQSANASGGEGGAGGIGGNAVATGGAGGAGGNAVAAGGAGGSAVSSSVAKGGSAFAKGGNATSSSVSNANNTNKVNVKNNIHNNVKNNIHNNVKNNIHNNVKNNVKGGWIPPGQQDKNL